MKLTGQISTKVNWRSEIIESIRTKQWYVHFTEYIVFMIASHYYDMYRLDILILFSLFYSCMGIPMLKMMWLWFVIYMPQRDATWYRVLIKTLFTTLMKQICSHFAKDIPKLICLQDKWNVLKKISLNFISYCLVINTSTSDQINKNGADHE